jgi:hypothetical protein
MHTRLGPSAAVWWIETPAQHTVNADVRWQKGGLPSVSYQSDVKDRVLVGLDSQSLVTRRISAGSPLAERASPPRLIVPPPRNHTTMAASNEWIQQGYHFWIPWEDAGCTARVTGGIPPFKTEAKRSNGVTHESANHFHVSPADCPVSRFLGQVALAASAHCKKRSPFPRGRDPQQ